ncbi:hypothetical protein ACOMHN_029882 [Nucella lapillus]
MTSTQRPQERGSATADFAFGLSSSEEEMGVNSSSPAARSGSKESTASTREDKRDSGVSSSNSSFPPLSHSGATAVRGRKKVIGGRKSRSRTKMLGQLLSPDQQRQLLKRSSSLPADVTSCAGHLTLLYEGL